MALGRGWVKKERGRLKTPVESRGNGWDNFLGRRCLAAGSYETGYTLLFNMVFNGYLQEKNAEETIINFFQYVCQRTQDEVQPHAGRDTIERRSRHGRTWDGVRLCHVPRALKSIGNVGKSTGA